MSKTQEPSCPERTDYIMGGGWGNAIQWFVPEEFKQPGQSYETLYTVVGWKNVIPKPGQTLAGRFEKSLRVFEFVSVDRQHDPPDMFFAKVKTVQIWGLEPGEEFPAWVIPKGIL